MVVQGITGCQLVWGSRSGSRSKVQGARCKEPGQGFGVGVAGSERGVGCGRRLRVLYRILVREYHRVVDFAVVIIVPSFHFPLSLPPSAFRLSADPVRPLKGRISSVLPIRGQDIDRGFVTPLSAMPRIISH